LWLSPQLLAVALFPALFQIQYSCERGNTDLSSLEVEVSGIDQIVNFIPTTTQYYVAASGETVLVRAQTSDPAAPTYYQLHQGGALLEAGALGVGGGEVTLSIPLGQAELKVDVRHPQGGRALYTVDFARVPGLVVSRTSEQIVLARSETLTDFGLSWDLNFYRNTAYECGLSGNYTFLVVEPADNPGVEAPLWVYLHGGGFGYYDQEGVYHAVKDQDEDTFNHEETFEDLVDRQLIAHTTENGTVADSTLTRRIQERYRLLLVAMCDHDLYSGRGAPYLNNPNGGQVNGLQATMAAVDYTVDNFPTSRVFAHGTSAGSLGVVSLATAYAAEDIYLTGIVADSWLYDPRIHTIFDAFVGSPGYPFNAGASLDLGMAKLGFDYAGLGVYPSALISDGFTDVPGMIIIGELDPFCGGNQETLPEASSAGLSNCAWLADPLRLAIAAQPDSPHVLDISPTGRHTDTNRPGPINDRVDDFVNEVLATNPPDPFN